MITQSEGGAGEGRKMTNGLVRPRKPFPEVEVGKWQLPTDLLSQALQTIGRWMDNPADTPGGILNASFFLLAESIFLLGWIVRRRRKTSEVLDISRPVVQQLEWEKDEELSARRSHCVIGAGLRDGGVPSPEYFSPTTTTSTTMTIALESSRRVEDASSEGVGVPRLASSSCSSSPISPPLGRAVMQQPPQVGTNTLIVRHPALIYCPVVTFIGGAANTSQRTETSLA